MIMERLTKRICDGTKTGIVACSEVCSGTGEEGCMELYALYNECEQFKEAVDKLAEYEDQEEQGMMLRLPCKVGDTVYRINPYAIEPIISMKVLQIRFGELYVGNSFLRIDAINDEDMGEICYFKNDVGKTVFLTKEEAEAALERMGG